MNLKTRKLAELDLQMRRGDKDGSNRKTYAAA